ncbi:MAG: hypothetical protein A2Y98_00590 [Candidatus Portnoybacteria bacterium RBG_19FT_COMBO_36_7]|uniref:Uncharacterized protein n=1 Tax=Candidatus Portnoybacteria bacterium RBG_19FT_COMBO_36_7 TaxID=1801992 RepID=A0A1G2F8L2_9BACT|nr:MAG: hypothetical protein A2Y98_00590 [Candidatus Portnoybacteria bacterium RBG_19FT_COMBO_36_7]
MRKIKYLGAILAAQILPAVALAQTGTLPSVTLTRGGILDLLNTILTWFAAIIFIVGIFVILYAAFLYMTAAGDEEKIGKAKRAFIYGLVGVGVAILAFGIWELVASFLQA